MMTDLATALGVGLFGVGVTSLMLVRLWVFAKALIR